MKSVYISMYLLKFLSTIRDSEIWKRSRCEGIRNCRQFMLKFFRFYCIGGSLCRRWNSPLTIDMFYWWTNNKKTIAPCSCRDSFYSCITYKRVLLAELRTRRASIYKVNILMNHIYIAKIFLARKKRGCGAGNVGSFYRIFPPK